MNLYCAPRFRSTSAISQRETGKNRGLTTAAAAMLSYYGPVKRSRRNLPAPHSAPPDNPPIWRRLHLRSDSSIATLHELLQIAFDWSDFHLHRFVIRGKEYGLSRIGGSTFRTDAKKAVLSQFHFRVNERFLYEYDFGDLWQHQIRFECIEPVREKKLYPVCVGGACASPPEDCGGPGAYMEKMDHHRWNPPMDELQLIA